jgi:hypothetical protein
MKMFLLIIKYLFYGAVVLFALALIAVGISTYSFNQTAKRKVKQLFKNQQEVKKKIITEEDIKGLPEPVQRYFKYTGVIGKEWITTVRLKQKGAMRLKPDGNWMPLEAEEYYTVENPGFVWLGRIKAAPLFMISAQDVYLDGKGGMHIKLLSTITVVDAKGKEIDEASLMRYFNEMMWFPTAYLSDKVKWEPVDENTARATLTDGDLSVSAVFYFDNEGKLTNFVAERGRDTGGGRLVKTTWSTPITGYKELAGLRLPAKGEGVWHLESGEFSYIKLEITDIEYNNPSLY